MDFEKLVNNIGSAVSSAAESKKKDVERRARREYGEKVRAASDDALPRILSVAREKGNYIMEEIVEEEVVPDPIPFLDEIIMYASAIKKLLNIANIIDWISEHKILAAIIAGGAVLLIILLLKTFL